jgi:uncharacterized protein YkwD
VLATAVLVAAAAPTAAWYQSRLADPPTHLQQSEVLDAPLRAPQPDDTGVEEPDRSDFAAAQARDPAPGPESDAEDEDEAPAAQESSDAATPDEPTDEDDVPSSGTARAAEVDTPAPEPEAEPAPESEPAPEPEPAPAQPTDPAGHLAGLVADFRASEGLPAFERSPGLDEVARNWARVLADEGALRHNPDLQEQVREHHGCCRIAENVVHNAPADVDRAHRSLLDSDGHRGNLAGDYQRIGIGIVIDDQNRLWGVQVFHGE